VRVYRPLAAPEARNELADVMASLVTIAWLEPQAPKNPVKPVSTWLVNPRVHAMFGDAAERERTSRDQTKADMARDFEILLRRRKQEHHEAA
jgi:hypothetical protein